MEKTLMEVMVKTLVTFLGMHIWQEHVVGTTHTHTHTHSWKDTYAHNQISSTGVSTINRALASGRKEGLLPPIPMFYSKGFICHDKQHRQDWSVHRGWDVSLTIGVINSITNVNITVYIYVPKHGTYLNVNVTVSF